MKKAFFAFLVAFLATCTFAYADITKDEAAMAIEDANVAIREIEDFGFSANATKDLLATAETVFKKAQNGTSAYSEVLVYTSQIHARKEKAFELWDLLKAIELKIEEYKAREVNTEISELLLREAWNSFEKERYSETEELIDELDKELDMQRAELSSGKVLLRAGKGFLQKHWVFILLLTATLWLVSSLSYKKWRKEKLKKQLQDMKIEEKAVQKLMQDTQEKHFKKSEISVVEYNTKMGAYKRRLNTIKATMPALENELKRKKFKQILKK